MVVISAGNILNSTFKVWFRNFLVYNLLGAIAALPLLVYCYTVLSGPLSLSKLQYFDLALIIGAFIVSNLITGFVSYSTFKSLRGERPGVGATISAGLTRIVPILGTGLIVALVIALACAPMIWMMFEQTSLGALLTLVMLVPMIIVTIMLSLAVPIAAVEGINPFAAVKRSVKLTNGSKGTIFGALFVIGIIERVTQKIIEAVLTADIRSLDDAKLFLWVVVGTSIMFMSLRGTAEAVAYHDIRTVREGVTTEDLASVFE